MNPKPETGFSGFMLLLARLWRARWFIVGCAAAFCIITYINLRFLTSETFRSQAVFYVTKEVDAVTMEALITSMDTIAAVRDKYRQQFPDSKDITDLIRFSKRFHYTREIVEDTSIRRRYSPAAVLEADAMSPQKAQTLTRLWVEEVLKRYGGFSGTESRFRAEAGRKLLEELSLKEKALTQRQAALHVRCVELEKRLYSAMETLSPARVPSDGSTRRMTTYSEKYAPHPPPYTVNVVSDTAKGPGWIEQQLQWDTELAQFSAELAHYKQQLPESARGGAGMEASNPLQVKIVELRAAVAGKQAALESLKRNIIRVQDEITTTGKTLETARADLSVVESELAALRLQQDFAGSNLAENLVPGYLGTQQLQQDAGLSRVDMSLVTPPSLPDKKVAPQRMVSAILAGMIGAILTCLVLAFVHVIERLPKLGN